MRLPRSNEVKNEVNKANEVNEVFYVFNEVF